MGALRIIAPLVLMLSACTATSTLDEHRASNDQDCARPEPISAGTTFNAGRLTLTLPTGWTVVEVPCAVGVWWELTGEIDGRLGLIQIRNGEPGAAEPIRRPCRQPSEGTYRTCERVMVGGTEWIRSIYEYDVLALRYRTVSDGTHFSVAALADLDREDDLARAEPILRSVRLTPGS